ncbi:MAG: tRNA epoxyqueuosine(34) reductase QueG [Anaerolineaceae bacterium]|nr:tRNA epoxyqueuosine(34) reductase QueG [Anaerolineaceae bacterium]
MNSSYEQVISNPESIKEAIKARAFSLGFSLCGITDNSPLESYARYEQWLEKGYHGEMAYLATERHRHMRADPRHLVPWVNSILVLATPYPLTDESTETNTGWIAGYVGQRDYHLTLPERGNELMRSLQTEFNLTFDWQIFCDSSPVLERELAVRAGLGWIGKNSCLINPQYGSALLLCEIFLSLPLPADAPFTKDYCGTCHRCSDQCPTRCILPERSVDARRCISNLTIENKNEIPAALMEPIGQHLFGCDRCQIVCPWNRKNRGSLNKTSQRSLAEMQKELLLSAAEFKQRYHEHPLSRAKRRGWVRNLCTVLGNLCDPSSLPSLQEVFLDDPEPLCRLAAARAIIQIDPTDGKQFLLEHVAHLSTEERKQITSL